MSFNKIQIVGYIGRDTEISMVGAKGTRLAKTSIATSTKIGDTEKTTWFTVNMWGDRWKIAESLTKGKYVFIEGTVDLEEFTDKDGNNRSKLVVTASNVNFLAQAKTEAPAKASKSKDTPKADAEEDDEIPF
jgi:single-strand DNA-binding protein